MNRLRNLTVAGWTAVLSASLLLACSSEPDAKDADAKAPGLDANNLADGADGATGSDTSGSDLADGVAPGDVAVAGLLQPRPLRFDEDLRAVWGSSAADVWIVGAKGRILHWNGKTVAPRDSGTTKNLNGVWGRGPSDVYIAGDGVILRWDGQQITDITPKSPINAVYRTVHAPLNGSALIVAGDKGVVVRRTPDGQWKEEVTGSNLDIQSIAAVDSGLLWAVGPQGQALKLSGGSWSTTAMPKANKTLRAVTAAPAGRLFAAGDGGYLAATDQGTWTATLANDPDSRDVEALWAPTDDEAWAIGTKGVLLHYVGKKWQLEDIAGTYMKTRTFRGMWGTTGNKDVRVGFAVGDGGAGVRLTPPACEGQPACTTPPAWQDFRAETVADLNSVAAAADGTIFACGQAGLLLKAASLDAPMYDLAAPVTGADLYDVSSEGWAVGQGGVVVFPKQGQWVSEIVPGGKDLYGITRFGSDAVLAVGDGGVAAMRGSGINLAVGKWQVETTGTQIPLRSVASMGPEAIAVGDFGTILHRDVGGKWTSEDSGQFANLTRVIAQGNEAVAVGETGVVLVRQGGQWKTVFQAQLGNLYGVTQRKDGTIVAVGYGGTLVVGKPGGAFHKLEGGPSWLLGVVSTSAGTLAVGKKGSVFTIPEVLP